MRHQAQYRARLSNLIVNAGNNSQVNDRKIKSLVKVKREHL